MKPFQGGNWGPKPYRRLKLSLKIQARFESEISRSVLSMWVFHAIIMISLVEIVDVAIPVRPLFRLVCLKDAHQKDAVGGPAFMSATTHVLVL